MLAGMLCFYLDRCTEAFEHLNTAARQLAAQFAVLMAYQTGGDTEGNTNTTSNTSSTSSNNNNNNNGGSNTNSGISVDKQVPTLFSYNPDSLLANADARKQLTRVNRLLHSRVQLWLARLHLTRRAPAEALALTAAVLGHVSHSSAAHFVRALAFEQQSAASADAALAAYKRASRPHSALTAQSMWTAPTPPGVGCGCYCSCAAALDDAEEFAAVGAALLKLHSVACTWRGVCVCVSGWRVCLSLCVCQLPAWR